MLGLHLKPDYFHTERFGRCYMHNGDEFIFKETGAKDYCPDFINRKREDKAAGTLENWLYANYGSYHPLYSWEATTERMGKPNSDKKRSYEIY